MSKPEKKTGKARAKRGTRATFQVLINRRGYDDFPQFWKWRYAFESDFYHKSTVNKKQYERLVLATRKEDLILVDFLYFYSKARVATPSSGRGKQFIATKREAFYSLVAADFDVLPQGFSSYSQLREYLRARFPHGLVLPTPSGKAKILFLIAQDMKADTGEFGPRWYCLKQLLGEERLLVFDSSVTALHKVYFNARMLDMWRSEVSRIKLMGRVSQLARHGGWDKSDPAALPASLEPLAESGSGGGEGDDREGESTAMRGAGSQGKERALKGSHAGGLEGAEGGGSAGTAEVAGLISGLPARRSPKASMASHRREESVGDVSGYRRHERVQARTYPDAGSIDPAPFDFASTSRPLKRRAADGGEEARKSVLSRYFGELPVGLSGLAGKGSPAFDDLLRLLVATPWLASKAELPQASLARAVGVSQPLINRFIRRLIKAGQLELVDQFYAKGRRSKGYRALGLLGGLHRQYFDAVKSRGSLGRQPPPESLGIDDGGWNAKLFELTNCFTQRDAYLDYVSRIPGVGDKKSRLKQARAAWKSHALRNSLPPT